MAVVQPKPLPAPVQLGSCSACVYWASQLDTMFGHCRCQPPMAHAWQSPSAGQLSALWPVTRADDWCGSWASK